MNRKSALFKRFLYNSAHAMPVVASLFLVSCTTTGPSLDASGAALQASLTAPQPANSSQVAINPVSPVQPTQNNPSTTLGFAAPQPPAATPNAVQVGVVQIGAAQIGAVQEASQLDKNSKLVSTAAAAASTNPPVNAAAPVDTTAKNVIASPLTTPEAAAAPALNTANLNAPSATALVVAANSAQAASANQVPLEPTADIAILSSAPPRAGQILTATRAQAAPAKKKSLFESLFATNKKPASLEAQNLAEGAPEPTQLALTTPAPSPTKKSNVAVKPVLQPIKLELKTIEEPLATAQENASTANNGELPGVRKGALFEIKRRDSLQDDSDVDIGETDSGPVLLASAGGLARLAPNGLKVQRESVDVACLKPQLVKILKKIESHYRSPVVVTSGFRSPGYNRRVRGAKNSLHMFCAAADVQVVGVGKWELARYARSLSGRGGVGTYCHTDSVHIDVGPDRDWNWRCSRRK